VSVTALHTNLAIAAPGYTGPEPSVLVWWRDYATQ